jgi:hypothetical protein
MLRASCTECPTMHPLCPLLGVLIMSAVLTANYFRGAWKLGILRAFGRRAQLSWRIQAAGFLAGCLPFVGSILVLSLMPTGAAGNVLATPGELAIEMALCGLGMHLLNDLVVDWGLAQATA